MMLAKTLILSQFMIAGVYGLSTNVTVEGLGNVIGLEEATKWTNRTVYSFRGIPYAQAPVGDLRFRPPVKIATWNGTLDGREFGDICPQTSNISPNDNEDCLTLNVYVPEIDDENASLPVMIWIHGGTFMSGYASSFQPHFLLEEDVILVVPQFRLGPLGLLCLQTDEVPGNVQFLDQIMAMQWVQDNIGYFGGNPNEVTLFGQSSGAASVNLHQFSPLSTGLFHRAIIQSGSAFAAWVMDYDPLQTAANFGAVVNCTDTNTTELAACFKALDVQTLLDGFDIYIGMYTLQGLTAMGGHRAVIQTAGTQRFLEEDPLTLLARSEYNQMPMIGGATKHDGSFPLATYYVGYFLPLGLNTDEEYLQYNLTSFVTASFGMTDQSGGISQTFMHSHYADGDIGDFYKMVPGLTDICSVLSFKAGVFQMLQANNRVNTSYLYRFGYFGENHALAALSSILPFETGVGHSDELYYLFPPTADLSDEDTVIAQRMVSLWTSFAITGQPTAEGKTWEPMSTAFGPYLIIDEEFYDGTNYLTEHTIALQEGMTAVERSLAPNIAPRLIVLFVATLSSVFRL